MSQGSQLVDFFGSGATVVMCGHLVMDYTATKPVLRSFPVNARKPSPEYLVQTYFSGDEYDGDYRHILDLHNDFKPMSKYQWAPLCREMLALYMRWIREAADIKAKRTEEMETPYICGVIQLLKTSCYAGADRARIYYDGHYFTYPSAVINKFYLAEKAFAELY